MISKLDRRRGRAFKIQEYKENRKMAEEIYIDDGIGGEHRVKYLDTNRVTVQTVTRHIVSESEYINYSMPAKVKLYQIDSWPYTEKLKTEIRTFHSTATK